METTTNVENSNSGLEVDNTENVTGAGIVNEVEKPTETTPEQTVDQTANISNLQDNGEVAQPSSPPEASIEVPASPAVPVEPELTPDEVIISNWLRNGKTEVKMNDLIQAGFDAEAIDPHLFEVGRFKLSRILLVSPYKIEKK